MLLQSDLPDRVLIPFLSVLLRISECAMVAAFSTTCNTKTLYKALTPHTQLLKLYCTDKSDRHTLRL